MDWRAAESQLDEEIFGQKLTPQDFYRSMMIKFFMSDAASADEDVSMAKAFMKFTYDNRELLKGFAGAYESPQTFDFRNVGVLLENDSMSYLTHRSMLLTDATLMSHQGEPTHSFLKIPDSGGDKHVYRDQSLVSSCADLTELGNWLKDYRELLIQGDVFYYPRIHAWETAEDWSFSGHVDPTPSLVEGDHLFDALVSSGKVIRRQGDDPVRTKLVQMVAEIELPFVDSVSGRDFSKICCDERQALESFRDFLRGQFLELLANEGSESFARNLARIGIEIRRGTRALARDYRAAHKKTAIQVTGASIGTVVASLVAIDAELYQHLPAIVGVGGGVAAILGLSESLLDRLGKARSDEHYFLWLLRSPSS